MKQVKAYRDILTPMIDAAYESITKTDSKLNTEWVRPDMFAKDDNELIAELSLAIKSGMLSQMKGIMKYQGLVDESEIQEEIDRIREDNLLLSK
jgi:hypothetical protein